MGLVVAALLSACAGATAGGESARAAALVVEAPSDGDTVDRASLRIRGSAPPGAEIVRDISFAPDDRTLANSDGDWAMTVELDDGENELTFRVGDDRDTEVTIRVDYVPASEVAGGALPPPRGTARSTLLPTPSASTAQDGRLGLTPTGPTESAIVASVTDGDTIRVLLNGQNVPVRYIGIDTPETQNSLEWMGPEASAANAALVAGREVVLEKDVSETDQYGRLLRYVWLEEDSGWLLVNLELLRRGYAAVTTYPPDVKYADALLLPAQRAAREAGLGLWGAPPAAARTPAPTPLPLVPQPPALGCEPSYPDICIPIGSADLDCGEIEWRRFTVLWSVANPDPHRFDGNADGVGCES